MNMKNKKVLATILTLIITVTALSGCSGIKTDEQGNSSNKDLPSNNEEQVQENAIINPFTGEYGYDEKLLTQRPIAIMINNIKDALPQKGISDADIIYELPVEGPITRLMAVFSDYTKVKNLGSIRSARHDFVELAIPLNAIYMHFGGSEAGLKAIKDNKVDDIEGLVMSGTAFYQEKGRPSVHSWFTNASLIQKGIEKKQYNTKMEKLEPLFNFAKPTENILESQTKVATDITMPISNYCIATFKYNESSKTYSKGQFGTGHIDANINKAVEITNVFVLYTNVTLLPNGSNKEVELEQGEGYYISNGKAVPVTFKKANKNSLIKFYDANGKELKVNTGKTWVCIADDSEKSKLKIS